MNAKWRRKVNIPRIGLHLHHILSASQCCEHLSGLAPHNADSNLDVKYKLGPITATAAATAAAAAAGVPPSVGVGQFAALVQQLETVAVAALQPEAVALVVPLPEAVAALAVQFPAAAAVRHHASVAEPPPAGFSAD
jgi:formate hydrogenlyase subunit 3/multisubunit Na+/H+ antiporter MnhD subunit